MGEDDSEIRIKLSTKAIGLLAVSFVSSVSVVVLGWVMLRAPDITPAEARHGWSAEAFESEETAQIVSAMPAFQITGPNGEQIVQDNSRANVRLWEAVLAVNGRHLDNIPQQVGDCVSWAYCHAGEIVICVEKQAGLISEFHRLFPPYVYGISRVQIGNGRIKGDGSCMAWACQGGQRYGVLRADAEGVPPYSGTVARKWGKYGPPNDLIEATKMYTIGTAASVRSAAEVRDAIANGYPVPFGAGRIGFDHVIVKQGRLVAIGKRGQPDDPGIWAHAQVCIGYDGSGAEPLFCILNSWGPLAGGKSPLQGEPPGSYWIGTSDMEFIARQGDAFAISGFAGFKARRIDFKLTKAIEPQRHQGTKDASAVAVGRSLAL